MNGKPAAAVRQGTFVDTDGSNTMVIWIDEVEASSPAEFTINGAKPAVQRLSSSVGSGVVSGVCAGVQGWR
jgi:hypothetical protein